MINRYAAVALVFLTACLAPTSPTPKDDLIEGVMRAPDFDLGADAPELTLTQGESGSATISVARDNAAPNEPIAVALSEAPAGVTLSGSFSSLASTATLTIGTTLATPAGNHVLVLTLSTSRTVRSANVKLNVLAKPVPSLIGLSLSSSSVSFRQGQSASISVQITKTGAAVSGTVGLSVSGVPAGMTATLAATSAADSENLALAADLSGNHGNHTLTVTATFAGSQNATIDVPVTLLGAQNVTVKVVTATNSAAAGDFILVEGISKVARPDGTATFFIPVGRGDPYSAAVFGGNVFSGRSETYFYQGLTKADPVLKKIGDFPIGGAVANMSLRVQVQRQDNGVVFTGANSLTLLPLWSIATLGGTPIASNSRASRPDAQQPPWGAMGATGRPSIGIDIPVANNVVFNMSGMMVELETTSASGTQNTLSTSNTDKLQPKTYLQAGRCSSGMLSATASATYTFGDDPSNQGEQTCGGVFGVPLATGSTLSEAITVPVPDASFTFFARELFIVAGDRSTALGVKVGSDCYNGSGTCLAPATPDGNGTYQHTYKYPGNPEFNAFSRHSLKNGAGTLFSLIRLGAGAQFGAPPAFPVPNVPVSMGYATPVTWNPNGFSGHLFRSIVSGSSHALYCYTTQASCTIPTWVRDLAPTFAMPTGTVSWVLSTTDNTETVDSFASLSAKDTVGSDDFTRDTSYRAIFNAGGISFP